MNLTVSSVSSGKKELFNIKRKQRDGLILKIHHTNGNNRKIRFLYACFNQKGHLLATANNEGNVYLIDFSTSKFWKLSNINSCTFMKFSPVQEDEILIGDSSGLINLVDCHASFVNGTFIGHKYPVKDASFSNDFLCVTNSHYEAIIWDLKTNSKTQVLDIEENCFLRHILFMPVTNHILGCFSDDVIQVWKYETLETLKQIQPQEFNKISVKNVTFTVNGTAMVISSHTPNLVLFLINNWSISKLITLPDFIHSIKYIAFIPQPNDGGYNRILAILSGQGVVYFYDFETNSVINDLTSNYEIIRFVCSSKGHLLALILCSGDIEIYDVIQYIQPNNEKQIVKSANNRKLKFRTQSININCITQEVKEILSIDKLKLIIKEFGKYPDLYRTKIWEELLQLPKNTDQYNAIINHVTIEAFENLQYQFPLMDKRFLKNLKQVLVNLVAWCPFFYYVDYLPLFVFPFVKVFHNMPLTCFEALCTIIVNWCQFWFEYFPLPPINVLAMIENLLMEHDLQLLNHLSKNNASSKLYAWTLLETAFSEVLTSSEWQIFWDHVFSNEPSFLIFAVVAYNIHQRLQLLSLDNYKKFEYFYHNQNPIDIKKFVMRIYGILENTSELNHPRQYLNQFQKIQIGQYPIFENYPKTLIKYNNKEDIKNELKQIEKDEYNLIKTHFEIMEQKKQTQNEDEDELRFREAEKVFKRKLLEEYEQLKKYRQRLTELSKKFEMKEKEIEKDQVKKFLGKNRKFRAEQEFSEEKLAKNGKKIEESKESRGEIQKVKTQVIVKKKKSKSGKKSEVFPENVEKESINQELVKKKKGESKKKSEILPEEIVKKKKGERKGKSKTFVKDSDRESGDLEEEEKSVKSSSSEDIRNLLKHYSKLLKYKYQIDDKLFDKSDINSDDLLVIQKQQEEINEEVENVKKIDKDKYYLKLLNISTAVSVLDNIIKQIKEELKKKYPDDDKVLKLQIETKQLGVQINSLTKLINKVETTNDDSSDSP